MKLAYLFLLSVAACGGETSTATDASTDGASDATVPTDAPSAVDSPAESPTEASTTDGGVIDQSKCAPSLQCGNPGESCCSQASPNCWCQSYGQPRCVAVKLTDAGGQPYGDAGSPGAPCTASNQCDVGLTCVAFGPGGTCLYCGD
jgi:hypothetical protein